MKEIGEDSRGNRLYIEPNEVGGHRYWSDEIGGGVVVWDTSLVSAEMLQLALTAENQKEVVVPISKESRQPDYYNIRGMIAKQIATAHYPYNAIGIVVENKTISRDDFWNLQDDQFKNKKLIEAQAAMDVMSSIGIEHVIAMSLDKYLEEK